MTCQHCGQPAQPRRRFCGLSCAKKYRCVCLCQNCGCQIECRGIGRPKRLCRKCNVRKQRRTDCVRLRENHRKRCRLYGVPYDPKVTGRAVFARDGYRCHICKRRTLLAFRFVNAKPHPQSPTIDHHPYPLSAGVLGHEWDNVKCACWLCNVRKSKKWSRQPLLFK